MWVGSCRGRFCSTHNDRFYQKRYIGRLNTINSGASIFRLKFTKKNTFLAKSQWDWLTGAVVRPAKHERCKNRTDFTRNGNQANDSQASIFRLKFTKKNTFLAKITVKLVHGWGRSILHGWNMQKSSRFYQKRNIGRLSQSIPKHRFSA